MRKELKKWGLFSLLILMVSFSLNAKEVHITVLGTSDVHGNIMNYDYYKVKTYSQGFATISTKVKEIRNENENVVLLDAGDLIQGTPLTYYYGKKMKPGKNYPMTKIMEIMKYDSGTVGNHEFNYGQESLHKIIDGTSFPILSANVVKENGELEFTPYTVIERDGVRIGILGLTTQSTTASETKGLKILNPVEVSKEYVKKLREEEKCDLVIISAHFGLDPEKRDGNYALPIAKQISGIDGIFTGHDHALIDMDVMGPDGYAVPILMPYKWGRALSRMDFHLTDESGKWEVIRNKTAHNVYDFKKTPVKADEDILSAGSKYHKVTLEYTQTVIGKTDKDFKDGYKDEIKGVSQGKLQNTPLVDLVNSVQMEYANADISLAAEFSSSANIKKGNITINDISSIYIYENYLFGMKITGEELRKLLEYEVRYYIQTKDGDATIAFNKNIPGYNYDMFKGVDFEIDISKVATKGAKDLESGKSFRIFNLMKDGKKVKSTDEFVLALNDYRFQSWGEKMHGGFLYSMGIRSEEEATKRITFVSQDVYGDEGQVRNLMIKYIKEKGMISPKVRQNWKLSGYDFSNLNGGKEMATLINEGIITVPTAGRFAVNFEAINLNDTLNEAEVKRISEKTGLSLAKLNRSKTKGDLYKKVLLLRDGKTYIIKKGDYLFKIAIDNDIEINKLANLNNIENVNQIFEGQKILIPMN